jgi:hypothetical protein
MFPSLPDAYAVKSHSKLCNKIVAVSKRLFTSDIKCGIENLLVRISNGQAEVGQSIHSTRNMYENKRKQLIRVFFNGIGTLNVTKP